MLDFISTNPFATIGFGYILPLLIVFWYSLPEYMQMRELDAEAQSKDRVYVPVQSMTDHVMFYCTILVPLFNIFCALLIIFVEASDGFFTWVMSVCENSEYHRLENDLPPIPSDTYKKPAEPK